MGNNRSISMIVFKYEISQQLEPRYSTDESGIWMGRTGTFITTRYLGGHENNIQ